MSTRFYMTRDVNGYNGFGIPWSLNGYSMVLATGAEQHVTVPSTFQNWIALFSYTPSANVWVDGITTAVAPTGAAAATTARLNPSARQVKAGDTISFISSDTTSPMVQVEFLGIEPFGGLV